MRLNRSLVFALALWMVAAAWAATTRATTVGAPDSQGLSNPVRPATFAAAPDRRPTAETPDDPSPAAPSGEEIRPRAPIGAADEPSAGGSPLRVSADLEPQTLRGPAVDDDDVLHLHEVTGNAVTVRATPVDDSGDPLDGGRVVVLRSGEWRTVHLAESLPIRDLTGHRLVIETLSGSGMAEIAASWLTSAETAAAAAIRPPRRHLTRAAQLTSEGMIDQAEAAGTLDHETAVVYRVYAIFGDARLPQAYRGDDTAVPDSLYLATVLSEWGSYAPSTQAILQPFLVPPAYQQGYHGAASVVSALDTPPSCSILGNWDYVENPGGKVRVWFDVNTHDQAAAGVYLTAAENTILPKLEGLMTGHPLLSDGNLGCNGGSGQLDVYLVDAPHSVTIGYGACSNSPTFILLRRDTSAPLLAHEIFHAFQWSMPLRAGGCIASQDYRWWAEASAQWVQDYVYPSDQGEQTAAPALLSDPKQPLDKHADPHWYGAYLLPFFVARSTGKTDFVRMTWENCQNSKATQALNDALAAAGAGDLSKVWPDFALYNWNQAPVDQYKSWDSLTANVEPSVTTGNIDAGSLPDHEAPLLVDLPHLSATYKHFVFSDLAISSVAFWNGITFDLEKMPVAFVGPFWNPQSPSPDAVKGIKVQALYKINGTWTQDDWTGKPYVLFCRDVKAERLEELVIVVSNSRLDDSAGTFKAPGMAPVLWVSGLGCYQWKGTATYSEATQDSSQTDTVTNLVWTRIEEPQQPPEITYLPTGSVTVTMGGTCSGGGTVQLSGLTSSLSTYNYVPSEAPSRKSYKGQAYESATVPATCKGTPALVFVGSWFLVLPGNPPTVPFSYTSFDGKHMTGSYKPANGLSWTWDLQAQQQ